MFVCLWVDHPWLALGWASQKLVHTRALPSDPGGSGDPPLLSVPADHPPQPPGCSDLTFQVFRGNQAQCYHEGDFLRERNREAVTRPSSFMRSFIHSSIQPACAGHLLTLGLLVLS